MIVQLPNGQTAEFPDSMSRAEVEYAITNSNIEPEYAPESGPIDAALVSAGESLTGYGRGIQNLYGKAVGDEGLQADLAVEDAEANRLMAPVREEYPVSTTIGPMLPGLATMPLGGGLLTQAGIGAGIGAADYGESQGSQGMLGGLLSGAGYGIGKGAQNIYNVVRHPGQGLTGEAARLAGRMDDLDMTLLPGHQTGSLPMQQLDASIKSTPMTSGLVEEGMNANTRTINRLAAESIGEAGEEITPDMLGNAATRIGRVYKTIADDVDEVVFEGKTLQEFYDVASEDTTKLIDRYIARFPGLGSGKMQPDEWMKLRQVMAKDSRGAWKNNPSIAEDLDELEDIMLDALEASSPNDVRGALRQAGNQWRNLKVLERGSTVTKGNVNPRSAHTGLKSADKRGYMRGGNKSDYYDAVRAANQFSDVVGDSGTATRSWLQRLTENPLQTLALSHVVRGASRGYLNSSGPTQTFYAGLLGTFPAGSGAGQVGAATARSGILNPE